MGNMHTIILTLGLGGWSGLFGYDTSAARKMAEARAMCMYRKRGMSAAVETMAGPAVWVLLVWVGGHTRIICHISQL